MFKWALNSTIDVYGEKWTLRYWMLQPVHVSDSSLQMLILYQRQLGMIIESFIIIKCSILHSILIYIQKIEDMIKRLNKVFSSFSFLFLVLPYVLYEVSLDIFIVKPPTCWKYGKCVLLFLLSFSLSIFYLSSFSFFQYTSAGRSVRIW